MLLRSPLTLVAFFAFVGTLFAQERWQVKSGVSYTVSRDPIGTGHGTRTGRAVYGMGMHAGAGYEHAWTEPFGLRMELLLDVRGCGYDLVPADLPFVLKEGGDAFANGRRITRMVHVEAPILISLRQWPLLRIDAGLSVARLLAAEEYISGEVIGLGGEGRVRRGVDRTTALAPWDVALVLGGEVDSGRRLGMGIRYKHGLTDVDHGGGSPSFLRTWQISLSYALGTGVGRS